MIRLLFVLFVTLGGFAAAAIWNFRSDDARQLAEKVVSPELRAAVAAEIDRLELPELPLQPPRPNPAVGAPEPVVAAPEPAVAAREPVVAAPEPAVAAREPATVAHGGAGGAAGPDEPDIEQAAEVEVLAPPAEFGRDFVPAADRGVETAGDVLPGDEAGIAVGPDWGEDSTPHDADRSALLIRRMLAVYRSSRAGP